MSVRTSLAILCSLILPFVALAPARAQWTVEDSEPERIVGVEPLRGLRPFEPELVWHIQTESALGISVETYADAVAQSDWFRYHVLPGVPSLGDDPIDFINAVCQYSYHSDWQASLARQEPQPVRVRTSTDADSVWVDANLIAALPATELMNCGSDPIVVSAAHQSDSQPWVIINAETANLWTSSYAYASDVESTSHNSWNTEGTLVALGSIAHSPKLASASEYTAGSVAFGEPLVWGANEAGAVVPKSVGARYDVYVIHFAATIQVPSSSDIEEMTLLIEPSKETIALDLIPLAYQVQGETKTSTGVGAEVGTGPVKFTSSFQREVTFTTARPIIVAHGLQERDFGWSVRGDAARAGSHRFVGVLGVPKGVREVPISMRAKVRYSATFFEKHLEVATNPKIITLHLNGE